MSAQLMMERTAVRPPVLSFGSADFAWEQSQEAALRAFRAGGTETAVLHWRRGLAIARQQFDPSDPRLAVSFTNCAFVQARRGDRFLALRDFQEAEEGFESSWRWVLKMRPQDDPEEVYDEATSARFRMLLKCTAQNSRDIWRTGELPVGLFERWRSDRPGRGCDLRKLLGAVLLIASRAPDPSRPFCND